MHYIALVSHVATPLRGIHVLRSLPVSIDAAEWAASKLSLSVSRLVFNDSKSWKTSLNFLILCSIESDGEKTAIFRGANR